jgi:undecaprenyl-diphosphatase
MNPFDALLLGLIQGLTEFLPISSSAHLQIAASLMHLDVAAPGQKNALTAFIATIQLGTEAAVLIYFWRDIVRIVSAWGKSLVSRKQPVSQDAKMGWLIIIGSIPVVVIGLLFKDFIETDLRNLWVIGVSLIVFGLILGLADRIGNRQLGIDKLTPAHGVLFGLGQALSVIPGVSRSGGTISVGLFLGYSRQAAARYSFLLAIPAVLASGLLEFVTSYKLLSSADLVATAIATAMSFAVGFAVIVVLLRYLSRGSFLPFVLWRVLVGSTILVLLGFGVLSA